MEQLKNQHLNTMTQNEIIYCPLCEANLNNFVNAMKRVENMMID